MPSEFGAKELAQVRPVFKALVMRNALYECTELDTRTVTVLQKNGLLSEVHLLSLPSDIVELLIRPAHPRRIASPPGPLVFVHGGDAQQAVVYVTDLLLHPDHAVRSASLGHFGLLAATHPKTLTPRSKVVIAQRGNEVCSTEPQQWRSAAIEIADRLQEDFLCNLAGIRQSLAMRFDEGMAQYFPPVLRPTVSSIDSITLPFPLPSAQRQELSTYMQDIVTTLGTLADAMDRYYETCGFIPLAETISMGSLVRAWASTHHIATDDLWDQVWRWADQQGSPCARYHACQAFCMNPHLVPVQSMSTLWAELVHIIHVTNAQDPERQWTQAWRFRCDLARHYMYYLECQLPGSDSERLALLTWWLAEEVATVFGLNAALLQRIREKTLLPTEELSGQLWALSHPSRKPSLLRYATLYTPSLWSLALQCQMVPLIQQSSFDQMETTVSSPMQNALQVSVLQACPLRPLSEGSETYAFEKTVIPTAKAWLDALEKGEHKDMFEGYIQVHERLSPREKLGELLDGFPQSPEPDQLLLASVIHVMAYLDELPVDVMWEHIMDVHWRDSVLRQGSGLALNLLFEAWTEMQVHHGGRWVSHLPHYYAGACESASEDPERQGLLFDFTVLSALASDTVSSLDRLLRGEKKQAFGQIALDWRQRLEHCQAVATPWLAARIRAILASLRIAG
jgi:hypothetical protein